MLTYPNTQCPETLPGQSGSPLFDSSEVIHGVLSGSENDDTVERWTMLDNSNYDFWLRSTLFWTQTIYTPWEATGLGKVPIFRQLGELAVAIITAAQILSDDLAELNSRFNQLKDTVLSLPDNVQAPPEVKEQVSSPGPIPAGTAA